jgi:hypothetical protein
MNRAAIIIGVDRAGDLPVLKDAAAGARRFEQWAHDQEFAAVKLLTDENGGAVDITQIKRAIHEIIDTGTIEQLIVYFAGHGVNIHYDSLRRILAPIRCAARFQCRRQH